jgi:glycosyltransferase 2 family protein
LPNADNENQTRHLSLVARVGVAVAAIGWVLHGQDWHELGKVFQRLNLGYFVLSLVAYAAAQLVIAFRWWLLLRAQSIHIDVLATFRLHFLGLFYNNIMPSSVGGDLLKAWYVTKHTDKRVEGALSVLVDRLVGLCGMVLMAVGAYLIFLRGRMIEGGEDAGGGLGLSLGAFRGAIFWSVAVIAAAVVVLLVYPRTRVAIGRIGSRIAVRGTALLRRAWTAVVVYCSKPVTMLLALLLTLVGQSVVVAAFWLLGRNLGLDAEAKHYFVIFPISWVVAAVPVSIAGLGVLEAGLVTLFTSLTAATGEGALALALCQRFVWVLVSLPGGGVHLLGRHLPSDFLVDGRNSVN